MCRFVGGADKQFQADHSISWRSTTGQQSYHTDSPTRKWCIKVKVAESETAARMQIQTTTRILPAFFSPSLWSQTWRWLYSNNTRDQKRKRKKSNK